MDKPLGAKTMRDTRLFYKISQALAVLAAVLAFLAGIFALTAVNTDTTIKMVETWRTVGFFTFAALFCLLAYKPTNNGYLWGILIANKAVLSIIGFVYGSAVTGAVTSAIWDSALTAILILGYLFSKAATGENTP